MTDALNTITIARVKELLDYDPATGLFTRKIGATWNAPAGPLKGSAHSAGYLTVRLDLKSYYLHRLAWAMHYDEWPLDVIDHINGNKSDNRIANLRSATHQQNQCNRTVYANNKSGFKGVSAFGSNFKAFIRVNKKTIYLGLRKTPEEAHELYKAAAVKYQGEYAKF